MLLTKFNISSKTVALHYNKQPEFANKKAYSLNIVIGKINAGWMGAGYKGGCTLYLAINCPQPYIKNPPMRKKFIQIGATRNAQIVPLCY